MPTTSAPPTHRFTRADIDAHVLDYLGLEYTSDPRCPIAEEPFPASLGGLPGETALQVRAENPEELARICLMLGRLFDNASDAADFATQLVPVSSRDGGPTIAARRYHVAG